ncbi:MAG: HAD family hydrolase [Anaerolineae bacterium]
MAAKLLSWNGTPTKEAILDFVAAVTNESGPHYVPTAERVATFDNDGTLWVEKPAYIQLFFAIQRLKDMGEVDPTLLEKPAFKAAATGDMGYFAGLYPGDIPALMQIIYDSHAGISQPEFERLAYVFMTHARHPRFGVTFKQCIYQPMLELMAYLKENDFKIFIASAGGMSFMRVVSEEIYQVPRENVIGSNITFEVGREDGRLILLRKPGLVDPPDDGPGKPVNIELHIGRPPILAAGNSDGDIEMLEFAEASGKPFLNLLLHHDDDEREYAYDHGAEKALQLAGERGWTVISIEQDFRQVFPTAARSGAA